MKKAIIASLLLFVGSILVIQFARYSSTQTAIIFEWLAVLALLFFVAISIWASGKYFFTSKNKEIPINRSNTEVASDFGISKRELEVLELIAEGFSNKQISEKLFVSESTVKKHASNIFAKLNANRRTEAIKIAYQTKLISPENLADPS